MEINATLLVQLVLFLGLMLWLSRFLFDPIMELFAERERRIDGAKKEAVLMQEKAAANLARVEGELKKARQEGRQILEELKKEGQEIKHKMVDQARNEAQIEMTKARQQVEKESQEAKIELESMLPNLAETIVKKVVSPKKKLVNSVERVSA